MVCKVQSNDKIAEYGVSSEEWKIQNKTAEYRVQRTEY